MEEEEEELANEKREGEARGGEGKRKMMMKMDENFPRGDTGNWE